MVNYLDMLGGCTSPVLGGILKVLQNFLNILQIIVPILLILMASINIVKIVLNPDEKKNISKIKNSFFAAVIIFFIPMLINTAMGLLGENFTISECWNDINNNSNASSYIDINTENRKKILSNSDDYEGYTEKENNDDESGNLIDGTAKQVGDIVWDPNDVTKISNITSAQLVKVLNSYSGNAKNFIPYASGLVSAENKHNVNVFFLLGVEALESGWVTSSISRNCNNLGGVCATSSHPSNGCGSNSNCSFAYFSSVNSFIDYHASMLEKNYLTPSGTYYHGKSASGVVVSYCPGCSAWPSDVNKIANSLFSEVSKVV